ncbi:DUF2076 domain-containing protein, partial [Serratia marcescens]|uniref:DUF2076 domain-containing protein n=1 Tax=Serratia marcescens TaxID=615 RepID=UPI0013D95348
EQERDILAGLFDRLRSAEGQQRDPQVDAFIRERLAQQPGAVYAMLQSIYVSDQTIAEISRQNEDLQGQLRQAQVQVQQLQH